MSNINKYTRTTARSQMPKTKRKKGKNLFVEEEGAA
jgi:hypothetical protein